MRSSSVVAKDARELFRSTAFLLLVLVASPLTGMSFITAVRAYAEASGGLALASALSPLDGLVVPTLGACDLLITFLVPFVAIRLVASEKSSGALKLLLQSPVSVAAQLGSKLVALFAAWLVVLLPTFIALVLWRTYGGHLALPETTNLLLGHTLRYLLTCCIAIAAAAILDGAASAAIAVLAFTIGTWAYDFFAAGRGLASSTPAAMLRQFERGLLSVDVLLATIVACAALLFVAAAFLDLRKSMRTRLWSCVIAALVMVAAFSVHTWRSADLSEDRRNSFSAADERLLRSIEKPVAITLYLAAEDPRANDYERNVLTRLRRTIRDLRVDYPYAGRTALFDNDPRYGTVVYRIGAKGTVSRSTTEEIVLDEIETLAGLTPPQRGEPQYAGYPLNASPRGAATLFYAGWPVAVAVVALIARRRRIRRTG